MLRYLVVAALWCSLNCIAATTPFDCDGRLYITSIATATQFQEVQLNGMGGFSLVDIGASHSENFNAIGYNRVDNYIYVMNPSTGNMYRLHKDGTFADLGVPTNFGPLGSYYVGDVDKNGIHWSYSPADEIAILTDVSTVPPTSIKRYDMAVPGIADWAFNPIDDNLYAIGSSGQVYVVDVSSCVDAPTLIIAGVLQPGSCSVSAIGPTFAGITGIGGNFFDPAGRLYGYENNNPTDGTGYMHVWDVLDPLNVMHQVVGTTPIVSGMDGTACPGNFDFFKEVSPEFAAFNNVVTYTFTVTTSFSSNLADLMIIDTLDVDMEWIDGSLVLVAGPVNNLMTNMYGGTNYLEITFDIPFGTGLVQFTVDALTPLAPPSNTVLTNQATLHNLPLFAEPPDGIRESDNPNTPDPMDTTVLMIELDFGDAPYETSIAQGGPYHVRVSGSVTPIQLGPLWDNELDGTPSVLANSDGPDDDGVALSGPFIPGQTNSIMVTISGESGDLEAWLDMSPTGTQGVFDPVEDYVVVEEPVSVGTQAVSFALQADSYQGLTYFRVRAHNSLNSVTPDTTPYLPTGQMNSGEVEDYITVVGCPLMPMINACTCLLPFWDFSTDVAESAGTLPLARMYHPYVMNITQLAASTSPFTDTNVELHLLTSDYRLDRVLASGVLGASGGFERTIVLHHVLTGEYHFGLYGTTNRCYLGRTRFLLDAADVIHPER